MAAIHDHANNIRTVGMGEFVAVINGVEFRTRHNDYRLYMPSNGKLLTHCFYVYDLVLYSKPEVNNLFFSQNV